MATDIFEFWSRIKTGEHIHPEDIRTFERMDARRHGFRLDCLPACFAGPLRDAGVVLLYLSPGFEKGEEKLARKPETKAKYAARWKGNELLPEHHWFQSRTKRFGPYDVVRKNVAVLNIGAYHSKKMDSFASMLALPSSRVTLDWAQNVLFEEALHGKRIVICMRSAAYWGLEVGRRYDGHLYAPETVRNGFLAKTYVDTKKILKAVRERIGAKPE